jgi:restriction system protein
VFITTSTFAQTAIDYTTSVAQKVILVDGRRLAKLMIESNIGVSDYRSFYIKKLDTDYFEEN